VKERFGIRHAEFLDHGPFKLNGERLLLRGTQRHMDHAGFAAAEPDALIRTEMELVKAMGANFIRLGHYQQTKLVLDLCDELGLLVWEEAPWCRSGVGDEKWQDQTRLMLANMIDQHFNHPSVIMWGLGNEDDWPGEYPALDQAAIRGFMQEMNSLAHEMDPSRFTSLRRCDFARDIPDVYSPSIWAGWYSGVYTDYQSALEKQRAQVKRFVHIEWGADSHARRHAEMPESAAKAPFGADLSENTPDSLEKGAKGCRVARQRLVRNLRLRSLRLVFESAGNAALAERIGAVGLQGFHHALARGKSRAARKPEGCHRARHDEEGRLLRLPVLLGRGAHGAHLRPHLAGALGRGGRRAS
jgi:hypothetical protein